MANFTLLLLLFLTLLQHLAPVSSFNSVSLAREFCSQSRAAKAVASKLDRSVTLYLQFGSFCNLNGFLPTQPGSSNALPGSVTNSLLNDVRSLRHIQLVRHRLAVWSTGGAPAACVKTTMALNQTPGPNVFVTCFKIMISAVSDRNGMSNRSKYNVMSGLCLLQYFFA